MTGSRIFSEEDKIALRKIRESMPELKRLLEEKEPENELGSGCLLIDPKVIVAPQDKGEPPSWVPAWHGEKVFWVNRPIFNQLKEKRHKKPCKICPDEIKKKCQVVKK